MQLPPSRSSPVQKTPATFSPLPWSEYFDRLTNVKIKERSVRVYSVGSKRPATKEHTILLCLHGAGYSGLTWAQFAHRISSDLECEVIAPDMRGHGDTKDSDPNDLSTNTLVQDTEELVEWIIKDYVIPPKIILLGHSLGGALATRVAGESKVQQFIFLLIIIDVVEGYCMDALKHMRAFINRRPKQFKSLTEATKWSYQQSAGRRRLHDNINAIRVSIPGQLKDIQTGIPATHFVSNESSTSSSSSEPFEQRTTLQRGFSKRNSLLPIKDVEKESFADSDTFENFPSMQNPEEGEGEKIRSPDTGFTWRTNLLLTEPHWENWFLGLSKCFGDLSIPRLLILCDLDRLDSTLLTKHMQGAFQMQLIKTGHCIQEDSPYELVDVVSAFIKRCKRALEISCTSKLTIHQSGSNKCTKNGLSSCR